jgi:hypothetical protein
VFSDVDILEFLPKTKYPAILDYHSGCFWLNKVQFSKKKNGIFFTFNFHDLTLFSVKAYNAKLDAHKIQYFSNAVEKFASCIASYDKQEFR